MEEKVDVQLPAHLRQRLEALATEVDAIIARGDRCVATRLPGPIALEYTHAAPIDLISAAERAQSVGFITRYEHLATDYPLDIVADGGTYRLRNIWFLRHVLNDFRPIIQNQRDAVYYTRVHATWARMLARQDERRGLRIRALDTQNQDVTRVFLKWLGEQKKAIATVLEALEYGYLYNGVLQHSDFRHSARLWADYTSGELNYVLVRHVLPLRRVHKLLEPYYRLAHVLTFPTLGPL